ncbi:MAG: CRISPR-associated endonuclease Cas2 [Candidatus Muirbacterium halophilum]|nr:CRISPR-associated endonuclease Cas2 [Candidatus Muirbacterium halophilum]
MKERYLRIILFFDLPTKTKSDKRNYILFRRFLLKQGFLMMQWSVYSRICKGDDSTDKYFRRIETNLPPKGNIRILKITEKQYAGMKLLLGKFIPEEQFGVQQLLVF